MMGGTAPIRRVTGFFFGSWLGTGFAAALLILMLVGLGWVASSGRLSDPQHLNIPVVRTWPPAGYYVNPFNPNDRGDLVSTPDANVVKGDFLRAGGLEIDALTRNDAEALTQADTGNRHRVLLDLLTQQKAQGIVRRYTSPSIERLWVGHLPDPNDASVTWCVEEIATQTEETVELRSGAVVKRQTFHADNRYWLVRTGDRWLITDALVRAQPVQ
jgi:hypothetical protein